MKNNNYSLDKNILTIQTECGDFKFKIDDDAGMSNAQRIAEVMTREMEKVEQKFNVNEHSNSYAKILLANLNISDKYIQLENKYNSLVQKYKEMRAFYQRPVNSQVNSPIKPQVKPDDTQQDRLKKNEFILNSKISDYQKTVNDISPEKIQIPTQPQRFSQKTNPDCDENT